jgi:IS30 family transposase
MSAKRPRRAPKSGKTAPLTDSDIARIGQMSAAGMSLREIAQAIGRGKTTVGKYVNNQTPDAGKMVGEQ